METLNYETNFNCKAVRENPSNSSKRSLDNLVSGSNGITKSFYFKLI